MWEKFEMCFCRNRWRRRFGGGLCTLVEVAFWLQCWAVWLGHFWWVWFVYFGGGGILVTLLFSPNHWFCASSIHEKAAIFVFFLAIPNTILRFTLSHKSRMLVSLTMFSTKCFDHCRRSSCTGSQSSAKASSTAKKSVPSSTPSPFSFSIFSTGYLSPLVVSHVIPIPILKNDLKWSIGNHKIQRKILCFSDLFLRERVDFDEACFKIISDFVEQQKSRCYHQRLGESQIPRHLRERVSSLFPILTPNSRLGHLRLLHRELIRTTKVVPAPTVEVDNHWVRDRPRYPEISKRSWIDPNFPSE